MAIRADFLMRLPLVLVLFLLAACAWNEPSVVDLPEPVEQVSAPFVAALQKGDRLAAEAVVAPGARDELATDFGGELAQLKGPPKLTPRFITYKPAEMMGPEDSEVTIIYAARSNGEWTTLEVRLFGLRDEGYEVDYWKISDKAPVAKSYVPDLRPMAGVFMVLAIAGLVIGILTIGITLWLVRRKPHILAPEAEAEQRTAAVTTRDDGD
jgi:hypothetical protein